jgi:sugar/nucleoside kinase (ribokinase family)
MNSAETVDVQLNVLAEDAPKVPAAFADSETVFLANTHPARQSDVLTQLRRPKLVVCDTMNHWITMERAALIETLRKVTGVIINDGEARQLTGKLNLIEAGETVLSLGPRFVIIKKGEHGSLLVSAEGAFTLPAYPTPEVRDPTGAGDSFAGGVVGYLAQQGRWDAPTLKRAMARGTVAASYTIEDFSLRRLERLTGEEVERRMQRFAEMLRLD